jgi:tRNA dimethylallyltransferase
LSARQSIGYKELLPVLSGQASLEDAVEQIKQATRRYAKRQRTWFRRDKRIHWLDGASMDENVLTTPCNPIKRS